ncbi:MAG: hypothetical protein V4694_01835 [Pseudomonadota bacterium]
MNNAVKKEQQSINELSQEAVQILDILDQIENHTAALRKKLIAELKPKTETVHLKLDNV